MLQNVINSEKHAKIATILKQRSKSYCERRLTTCANDVGKAGVGKLRKCLASLRFSVAGHFRLDSAVPGAGKNEAEKKTKTAERDTTMEQGEEEAPTKSRCSAYGRAAGREAPRRLRDALRGLRRGLRPVRLLARAQGLVEPQGGVAPAWDTRKPLANPGGRYHPAAQWCKDAPEGDQLPNRRIHLLILVLLDHRNGLTR